MHNISSNYSPALTQTARTKGGLGPPVVRVLPTLATLSVLRPSRATTGGRSKPQRVTGVVQWQPGAPSVAHPVTGTGTKRTGARVRESAGALQRTGNAEHDAPACEPAASPVKREQKTGRTKRRRPPARRCGTASCAGSRRKQRRSQALDDFAVVRRQRSAGSPHQKTARNSEQDDQNPDQYRNRPFSTCTGPFVRLRQDNFRSIHDNLDGCYGLEENLVLRGDQARDMFPVGNSTHPFTGFILSQSIRGVPLYVSVHLERLQGDAVLFGAARDAEIRLYLQDTSLVAHNGSRAALVGELQGNNWLGTTGLHNSLFNATGTGLVQAGLVGTTLGAHNTLAVRGVSGTRMQALAVGASGSCQPQALASLGLGVLQSSGRQDVFQQGIRDNQLRARADNGWAATAMLGVLGQPHGHSGQLWSLQHQLYDNSLLAEGGQELHGGGYTGGSRASLGYGDIPCALPVAAPPGTRLYALQADWVNNSAQAVPGSHQVATLAADKGTRTSLVATGAVDFVRLQQRGLAPGQLHGSLEGGSVLPAAREMALSLFSGGDARLPLFAAEPDGPRHVTGLVDTASFQWAGSGDAHANENALVRVNSLQPQGWRAAYEAFRDSASLLPSWPLYIAQWDCLSKSAGGGRFHYTGERLESMTRFDGGGLLLTRQRYPWQQDHDLRGLLRVTRYALKDLSFVPPSTQASLDNGGIRLYQPHPRAPLLQDARAGYSLVQDNLLHQLYQKPGHSPQLVSLALDESDSHYLVRQYDELAGQARLLSVEDGELHLWMQQEANDTLLAYGLGTAPLPLATNTSSWLRWGVDVSAQPGGPVALAREGHWLYAVRQASNGTASLRRWQMEAFALDPDWQPDWPGRVTPDLRLLLVGRRLVGAGADGLGTPYRFQLPAAGGCMSRRIGAWPPWRSLPPAAASEEPRPSVASTVSVAPPSSREEPSRSGNGDAIPGWPEVAAGVALASGAVLGVGLMGCLFVWIRRHPRPTPDAREAGGQAGRPAAQQQPAVLEQEAGRTRQQRLPPSEQAVDR